jgi:hypothetical protein
MASFTPRLFYPQGASGTRGVRSWVGFRAGLVVFLE